MNIQIRHIEKKDNEQLAKVVREVLIEYNVPKTGTAYEDPELDMMFETYLNPKSIYYVLESEEGNILGGGGVAPLQNGDPAICELQKMYFSPLARGKGLGSKMIDICLDFAKQNQFSQCYIETMENMKEAQRLYEKKGFSYLDKSMGNTGHCSCNVWLLKDI